MLTNLMIVCSVVNQVVGNGDSVYPRCGAQAPFVQWLEKAHRTFGAWTLVSLGSRETVPLPPFQSHLV